MIEIIDNYNWFLFIIYLLWVSLYFILYIYIWILLYYISILILYLLFGDILCCAWAYKDYTFLFYVIALQKPGPAIKSFESLSGFWELSSFSLHLNIWILCSGEAPVGLYILSSSTSNLPTAVEGLKKRRKGALGSLPTIRGCGI